MLRSRNNGMILMAPRRGDPPSTPAGYLRDKGDPYIFHKDIKRCKHLQEVLIKRKCCGGDTSYLKCGITGRPAICKDCDHAEKDI